MRLTQIRQPTKRRHHVDKQRKRGRTFIVPTPSTLGDDDDADDDDDGRERERERERERCRRVMMSQQPGKKEGVHMVHKIGTKKKKKKKKKRKKKTMRNSNARVALAKKAKRSRMERRRRSSSKSAGRDGGRPNDAGDCAGDGAV
jgi:transposase